MVSNASPKYKYVVRIAFVLTAFLPELRNKKAILIFNIWIRALSIVAFFDLFLGDTPIRFVSQHTAGNLIAYC